ncbi:MAG: DUF4097 family beta strand repeat protein [Pseudonocardiales bacterium]|nr:DUF4097 family beta strand repeat protein [Pseudonocardiales bacterium]
MPAFDTPEPISVEVAPIVGDVRVIASDRADTVVEVRPSDPASEIDVTAAEQTRVELSHGRLVVKAPKRKHYSLFGTGGSIEVSIELPTGSHVQGDAAMADFRGEGRLGECRIKSSTGHIWLDRTGPLHLSTTGGDVTVDHADGDSHVTGSGEIRLREVAGTAEIKNLNGNSWVGEVTGDLRCSAANGDIAVDRAHAGVRATTASGSIRVGEAVRGSIALDTAFGQLEIGIRTGTAALLDVRSGFGHIRNSLDASDGPKPSDETVEVRARSSYGDIVIRRS